MLHELLIICLFGISCAISTIGLLSSQAYSLFYWLGLLFLGAYFLLSALTGSEIMHGYAIFMALFCFVSYLIQSYLNAASYRCATQQKEKQESSSNLALGLVFYAISIAFYVKSIGGVENVVKTWIITGSDSSDLFSKNLSLFFYIISMSVLAHKYLITQKKTYVVIAVGLGLAFAFLLRVKLFILPGILPFLYIELSSSKTLLQKAASGLTGVLLLLGGYLATKFFRWLGNLDNIGNAGEIQNRIDLVVGSGVESELIFQSQGIFEWGLTNSLYGQTYIKAFFLPIARSLENPMYLYSNTLYGSGGSLLQGSAHPTVISDAFANFGVFGIITPILILPVLYAVSTYFQNKSKSSFLFYITLLSLSVPLIIRGSVYYGFYYLFIHAFIYIVLHGLYELFKGNAKNNTIIESHSGT